MKRVMIVGGPGSGKSTLARLLGERTGLPVHHMDHIHWKPGWQVRSRDDKDRMTHEVHMQDEWIFEGGHSNTYEERLLRADTFIWLDFPVWLRLFRVLKRSLVYYGRNRPDLPEGCPERLNWQTAEFVWFILRTRVKSRSRLATIYRAPPDHLKTIRLKSLSQVSGFLSGIGADDRVER